MGEWSLPVLVSTHKLFVVFFFPVQLRMGVIEQLWSAPAIQMGSTHHTLILTKLSGEAAVPDSFPKEKKTSPQTVKGYSYIKSFSTL